MTLAFKIAFLSNYNDGMNAKLRFVHGEGWEKKKKERQTLFRLIPLFCAGSFTVGLLFGLTLTEAAILGAGIPAILIVMSEHGISEKAKKKTRKLRLGLADLLERLAVLVDAGVPLWSAIATVSGYMEKNDGALGEELNRTVSEYVNPNGYFYRPEEALENMAKRCGDSQVSTFVSLILQNSRKGADELAPLLRMHAAAQREERKSLSKQMADEASTLMVIPSVMVLISVMALTAAPALIRLFYG
ncbi:MAG: type II secretion system F family protein [Clostridia bacterium]|nr:type II secretion system F family protein [Clostridia bacterium]